MLAMVCSAAVNGIEAYPVEVEVNVGFGDTLVILLGLPDAAVKESKVRAEMHVLMQEICAKAENICGLCFQATIFMWLI